MTLKLWSRLCRSLEKTSKCNSFLDNISRQQKKSVQAVCRLSLGHCNWCMFCRQEPHTFQYLHDATAMSEAMQCHLTRGRNNISMYITYFPSRPCDAGIDKHLGSMLGSLQRSLFFYDYYSGRQLARIVVLPQLRRINLTVHLLSPHSHALRCSLNTAAFQAASAQPGDHPL